MIKEFGRGDFINPSNAEATFVPSMSSTQSFFEKYLNPAMLVFIG